MAERALLLVGVGLATVFLGCGPNTDELTNHTLVAPARGGASGSSSAGAATGDTSASGGTSAAQNQAAADAKALFDALEPKLASSCGPCHVTGTSSAPIWLGAPDAYASIKAYKGIVVSDPKTSLLLTKPQHEGPALPAALAPDVTAWLTAEAAAVTTTSKSTDTSAIALPNGPTTIELPAPGGQLTFTASYSSGILTLKSVMLAAPATTGVHAAGVHLDIHHSGGGSTRDETLSGTDVTAPKGGTTALGLGLLVVPNVASTDQIAFSFDVLEASNGGTTTATSGCKDVTSFKTNAVPAIQANTCLNCHNTGGSGFGALDLSALAGATPDFAKACGQAKSKIDTTTPAQSPIILAPTGGEAGHPFKNASAQFKTQMTTWINAEK